MAKKKKTRVLTPWELKVLDMAKEKAGELVSLSSIQRATGMSFLKACEIANNLSEKGLIKSNVNELNISI